MAKKKDVTKMKVSIDKMAERFNDINVEMNKLKKEQTDLRLILLGQVLQKYPDESRAAKLEVGDFIVHRIVATKFKWDNDKLKKIIGDDLYTSVIDIKETVNEDRLSEKCKVGEIKKIDVLKACDVNYERRLSVKLKKEDSEETSSQRPLVEVLDV